MATRSQRRKEKKKQQRKEKKKQQRTRKTEVESQSRSGTWATSRHRQRVLQQVPHAWPDESLEDVAIFEDSALETLTPEVASQVVAVREALQLACDSRGEDALEHVSEIARNSPLSDWRLYLRGLVAWLAEDYDTAGKSWQRLDFKRRPGRMANAMMGAISTDLASDSKPNAKTESDDSPVYDWRPQLDDKLRYHAKLLRRVRFDRASIKIAEAGALAPEESKELLLGPKKIRWLIRFVNEFHELESELTDALQQVALGRAYSQNFSDVFSEAAAELAGPRHDRRNLLLSFYYFSRFDRDRSAETEAQQFLKRYLQEDLPKNEKLSEPLRKAIASQIYLQEAKLEIQPQSQDFFSFYQKPGDSKAIRENLKAAIKEYPANRSAYKTYFEWLEAKLENQRLTKLKRKPILEEQAQIAKKWSQGLPEDVEPRLWLVDYLLENEQMEEAKPHVEWLAGARQDNPRVRATPWKWQLLEAMRLCRRKAWLKDVPDHLDEAERLWPTWLSRDWLPYLRVALILRSGDREEFETQRQEISNESGVKRDSLVDACMMLGAAQHMRVPAADLKPLRAPVDQAVKNLKQMSDQELLSVSAFFWDLHRTQLLYPAYRMHGGKIVNEMFACLKENPKLVFKHLDEDRIHATILLCSEHQCLGNSYELKLPDWYENPAVKKHPMFSAAKLNGVLKLRSIRGMRDYKELGVELRELALSQRDSYYRYWFVALAEELEELLASNSSSPFGFAFDQFAEMFGDDDDDEDDDDDDDDDDLGFDPECDCPACQAARRAYEASRK